MSADIILLNYSSIKKVSLKSLTTSSILSLNLVAAWILEVPIFFEATIFFYGVTTLPQAFLVPL